jgi:hypothetical protein
MNREPLSEFRLEQLAHDTSNPLLASMAREVLEGREDLRLGVPLMGSKERFMKLRFLLLDNLEARLEAGMSMTDISSTFIKWDGIDTNPVFRKTVPAFSPAHVPMYGDVRSWFLKQRPRSFWGWEREWFLLDGMPARAPQGWAERPRGPRPPHAVDATCSLWYNHLWRGGNPCPFGWSCTHVHALPSLPPRADPVEAAF